MGIKVGGTYREGLLEARLEYLPRLRLEDVPLEIPAQPRAPNGLKQGNNLRCVNRDSQPPQRRVRARFGEGARRCSHRRISNHRQEPVEPDAQLSACVGVAVLQQV